MKHKDEWLLASAIALPVFGVWTYVQSDLPLAFLAVLFCWWFALSVGVAYYSRARAQGWLLGFAMALIVSPLIAFGAVWASARRARINPAN
jgi:ABC-type proline/glycine betaine transport system permease subunit